VRGRLSTINEKYLLEQFTVSKFFTFLPFLIAKTARCEGFRMQPSPIALLQRWYSLVREKRPTRQDFLKALVKVFQENPSNQISQVFTYVLTCCVACP
jgi:cohesin loading factor subunit SCC2